jgi:alpha-glucosidase
VPFRPGRTGAAGHRHAAAASSGSVCLYQGEELGLPETDLLFEELTDPPGIRFWPEYKGRDGCRTPIPWEEGDAPNGFTTGTPWLPVKQPQSLLNVAAQNTGEASTLGFYRQMLAFRRANPVLIEGGIEFIKASEPVLAFRRTGGDGDLVCIFNLSAEAVRVTIDNAPPDLEPLSVSQEAELKGKRLVLGPNGYALIPESAGRLAIKFVRRSKRA